MARHLPQRQRHPGRRRPLRRPGSSRQQPGQRAQQQKGQRKQSRRWRQQQRRIQRRAPSGQISFHKPAALPDLPDQHPQGNDRQHINIIALQPRRRRGPGPGPQKIQYAQPRQAAAGHRQHRQTQQAAHRPHRVHLPGQRHRQRRFADAGAGRRINGAGQQQTANPPGQQRPNHRSGQYDAALAQSQQSANLADAGPPAPQQGRLRGPRPRQQAHRQRQKIQNDHHHQRDKQEQRRPRQRQLPLVSRQQAGVAAVLQAGQYVGTGELAVNVRFQRRQVVPRVLNRFRRDDVRINIQKPAVIPHQRGVRHANAVKVRRFGHIYGRCRAALPIGNAEVIRRTHPILRARVNRFGDAHNVNGNVLRRFLIPAWKNHQPGFLAHSPAHQPRRVDAQRPLHPRLPVVILRYRIRRPAPCHQSGVFGEPGNEKRPPQRNVVYAVGRAHLSEGQRGQHLGIAIPVSQQVAHILLDNVLNIRPEGGIVLRPEGTVAYHNLRVNHHRRSDRQRVTQPRLGQRLRVHCPQGHNRNRGQHAESRNRQQPPRRAHPPRQQPQQQGQPRHQHKPRRRFAAPLNPRFIYRCSLPFPPRCVPAAAAAAPRRRDGIPPHEETRSI